MFLLSAPGLRTIASHENVINAPSENKTLYFQSVAIYPTNGSIAGAGHAAERVAGLGWTSGPIWQPWCWLLDVGLEEASQQGRF